jgi:outer membrane receptor protein involved in Fe transport
MHHCKSLVWNHCLIFVGLLATFSQGLAAQDVAGEDNKSPLQEIVITATKSNQTLGDLPNNVTVITKSEIDNSVAQTVDTLMRQIPGFNMLRQQDSMAASPTTQGVSLRGIGGTAASRSLVMLDGIPVHDAFASQVYWAKIPKHRIERIEVVRGGGSTLWGNRTVGGVINIITEEPRAGGLDFTAAYGSSDSLDLSAGATHVTGDWSLSADANYFDTDGYWNIPEDERDPINVKVAKEAKNIGGRVGYAVSDQLNLFVNANWLDEERQDDTPLNVNDTNVFSMGTGGDFKTKSGSNWSFNLFSDFADLEDASARAIDDGNADQLTGYVDQDSTAIGANLVWTRQVGDKHQLSAGTDYLYADADIDQYLDYTGGQPTRLKKIDADQQLFGFFVQDVYSFSDAWEFIASLRFDYVENDGSSVDTQIPGGGFLDSEDFEKNDETTINPSLGFRYRASDMWSFRGSAYGGFRAATLRELYRSTLIGGRSVVLTANPNLGPEELQGIEGGIDFSYGDNLLIRSTLFYNVVDDVIQNVTIDTAGDVDEVIEPCGLVPAGLVCQQLQNVGELEATGLEVEVDYQPHPDWRLFASYLLQNVEISEADGNPQLVGNKVRQSADNQYTAKVEYSKPQLFNLALQGRYVGERYENDLNTLEVDDFFLVDLVLSRSFGESINVFVSAENIFDEEYEVSVNARGAREIGRDRFLTVGFRYSH